MPRVSPRIFHAITQINLPTLEAPLEFPTQSHARILICTNGTASVQRNSSVILLQKGTVLIVLEGQLFHIDSAQDFVCYELQYRSDNLQAGRHLVKEMQGYHALFSIEPTIARGKSGYQVPQLPADIYQRVCYCAQCIDEEQQLQTPGFEQILNSQLLILITYIARAFLDELRDTPRPEFRLSAAVTYLETNFFWEVDIEALAARVGYSKRHLSRMFQQTYHVSPMQYVLNLRLDRASTLLKETRQNITEIAFACGFQDSNYFSRQFHVHFHISPSAYRQRYSDTTNHEL